MLKFLHWLIKLAFFIIREILFFTWVRRLCRYKRKLKQRIFIEHLRNKAKQLEREQNKRDQKEIDKANKPKDSLAGVSTMLPENTVTIQPSTYMQGRLAEEAVIREANKRNIKEIIKKLPKNFADYHSNKVVSLPVKVTRLPFVAKFFVRDMSGNYGDGHVTIQPGCWIREDGFYKCFPEFDWEYLNKNKIKAGYIMPLPVFCTLTGCFLKSNRITREKWLAFDPEICAIYQAWQNLDRYLMLDSLENLPSHYRIVDKKRKVVCVDDTKVPPEKEKRYTLTHKEILKLPGMCAQTLLDDLRPGGRFDSNITDNCNFIIKEEVYEHLRFLFPELNFDEYKGK